MAGSKRPIKMPIIAMATRSSTNVKARRNGRKVLFLQSRVVHGIDNAVVDAATARYFAEGARPSNGATAPRLETIVAGRTDRLAIPPQACQRLARTGANLAIRVFFAE